MKTLWFREIYRAPILAGEKTDTIRLRDRCRLQRGDVVAFAVGPRPRFAVAEIVEREENIDVAALPPERRAQIEDIYGQGDFCRLIFRLLSSE